MKDFTFDPSRVINAGYTNELTEKQIKQLDEFTVQLCKHVECMDDLTKEEARLWLEALKKESFMGEDYEYPDDFFDEEWEGYDECIRIIRWEWTHDGITDILIDMNGWPGDNEMGAIFLNGVAIFGNGDRDLVPLDGVPLNVKERLDAFIHIRDANNGAECRDHASCVVAGDFFESLREAGSVVPKPAPIMNVPRVVIIDECS